MENRQHLFPVLEKKSFLTQSLRPDVLIFFTTWYGSNKYQTVIYPVVMHSRIYWWTWSVIWIRHDVLTFASCVAGVAYTSWPSIKVLSKHFLSNASKLLIPLYPMHTRWILLASTSMICLLATSMLIIV
jgi:hypothetical protein